MKKKNEPLLLVLIAALLLSACGGADTAAVPSPAPELESQAQAEPSPVQEPAAINTPLPQEDMGQQPDFLSSFLRQLPYNIQPGSAGCSLKAVAQACLLLDWALSGEMNSEEVHNLSAEFFDSIPQTEQELYDPALALLDEACRSLKNPGQEELLASAGCALSGYPWPEEAFLLTDSIMSAAGLRQELGSFSAADSEAGVYAQLIDSYFAALSSADPAAALAGSGLNSGICGYISAHPLSSLGYCLYDINGDGLRELLVGPLTEPYLALDIYSISANQAIALFHGGPGNVCLVTGEGLLMNYVFKDAQRFAYNFFTLGAQGLGFTGGYSHDSVYAPANPWYKSFDLDMNVSNDQPCHAAQAEEAVSAAMAAAVSFDYQAFALMN